MYGYTEIHFSSQKNILFMKVVSCESIFHLFGLRHCPTIKAIPWKMKKQEKRMKRYYLQLRKTQLLLSDKEPLPWIISICVKSQMPIYCVLDYKFNEYIWCSSFGDICRQTFDIEPPKIKKKGCINRQLKFNP